MPRINNNMWQDLNNNKNSNITKKFYDLKNEHLHHDLTITDVFTNNSTLDLNTVESFEGQFYDLSGVFKSSVLNQAISFEILSNEYADRIKENELLKEKLQKTLEAKAASIDNKLQELNTQYLTAVAELDQRDEQRSILTAKLESSIESSRIDKLIWKLSLKIIIG